MPEKESGRGRGSRSPSTPADYPTNPLPLSGMDHSFLLQAIMEVQRSIGQLTQATTTLADDSKEHSKELKDIGKDLHAAKVVGTVIGVAGGILGFAIKLLLDYLSKK